ncbi:hypothetical protein EYR36_002709 [Pleurotus pulmonarius]|nr:hypothetical protein EYR36_002709 [Pleurotus pulmonarius]
MFLQTTLLMIIAMLTIATIVLGMGKRKLSSLHAFYPSNDPSNDPSTSIRLHRTTTGRLGHNTKISYTQDVADNVPDPSVDDGMNPWHESFFTPTEPPPTFGNVDGVPESNTGEKASESSKKTNSTKSPPTPYLIEYLTYRQNILNEFILQDGRMGAWLCYECLVEDGIHLVDIVFCHCFLGSLSTRREQLLHGRLLLASFKVPQAAFTFELLETFHGLTLQSKISAYDFYRSVKHKSDNTGMEPMPDYYERFLDAMRVYRNIKMLKRAGRGHHPGGVHTTTTGECAVECPACPHPGRNIPENWDQLPDALGWKHSLILTMDMNFRLKNCERLIINDVSLSDGWGHWVPLSPYHEYVTVHAQDADTNLCDSHWRAINQANLKRSSGYVATGVGGIICGRHGLVRRNGLGDLQKGERYANMDFIFFQSILNSPFCRLLLSYDIVCQYSCNLFQRMKQLPSTLQLPERLTKRFSFVVPKFHLYGHGMQCQLCYSGNLLRWSAQSDLEDPERWWAHINPVRSGLLSAFKEAKEMRVHHATLHQQFTNSFPSDVIRAWESEVTKWEADPTRSNPFDDTNPHDNMALVRLELAKEEAVEVEAPPGGTGPVAFLCAGLDIEEKQRTLLAQHAQTTHQEANLQEQQNSLLRRIQAWRELQQSYMPIVASTVLAEARIDLEHPETIPLFLPSQVSTSPLALQPLRVKESRLRVGQADDALVELRRLLRITMGMWHFKFTDVGFSQHGNTRARTTIDRFQIKVNRTAARYRAARDALVSLDPDSPSLQRLRELKQTDIRCPQREEEQPRPGESRRELSWIWLSESPSVAGFKHLSEDRHPISEEDINDTLRAEWARSRARAARWAEEYELVQEEMRRVIAYLKWDAEQWQDRRVLRRDDDNSTDALSDGLRAYASKQASIRWRLRRKFAHTWGPYLVAGGIEADWLSDTRIAYQIRCPSTIATSSRSSVAAAGAMPSNIQSTTTTNTGNTPTSALEAARFAGVHAQERGPIDTLD